MTSISNAYYQLNPQGNNKEYLLTEDESTLGFTSRPARSSPPISVEIRNTDKWYGTAYKRDGQTYADLTVTSLNGFKTLYGEYVIRYPDNMFVKYRGNYYNIENNPIISGDSSHNFELLLTNRNGGERLQFIGSKPNKMVIIDSGLENELSIIDVEIHIPIPRLSGGIIRKPKKGRKIKTNKRLKKYRKKTNKRRV